MNDKQSQPAEELIISVDTANAVVSYLASRPYVEVFRLIEAMQQCKPLPSKAKD